ncbi:Uncharacterised protein [Enterococcus casseliflavus]|jgi:hypothetical protein|uniref:hypothetical protein n=1 Tax=Enterococcus casseliflavus TaxID=37734 RepID=UPI000E081754|nr:hypothetical protein [Enterococcus casseliflavus]GEB28709.1 hypothetical protein ECA02_18040 [Enterococcus casseliflavus]STP32841.1 Uncharacterised protein [Enterococcus casseliflavus]
MTKKVYVTIEIIKIFFLSWFVGMVYDAAISSNCPDSEMAVIGYTFLIMLGTLVISSIVLDILISFFIPKENQVIGEWEKLINKNILRNFSYALSVFFVIIMAAFALTAAQEQIIMILRMGFIVLITTINLTKAYYYAG